MTIKPEKVCFGAGNFDTPLARSWRGVPKTKFPKAPPTMEGVPAIDIGAHAAPVTAVVDAGLAWFLATRHQPVPKSSGGTCHEPTFGHQNVSKRAAPPGRVYTRGAPRKCAAPP